MSPALTIAVKGSVPLEKTPMPMKMKERNKPRRIDDDKRIMMMLRTERPSSSL